MYAVFVCASTECFHQLPLREALDRLVDLEYSAVEVALFDGGNQLTPLYVATDLERSVAMCRDTNRLDLAAFDVQIDATGEEHYRRFTAICQLAKATKVVTLTVPSAELGTPFNEEVEHLRKLVAIAELHGTRVSIKSRVGRLSEDPDTVIVLCENVKGLGLTLDPTHYLCTPVKIKSTDKLMPYVFHVHLRDSTKSAPQVRIGQGELEYGKLIGQLRKMKYMRSLSVNVTEMDGVDHSSEMRKMRLLLESLL